jgi:hypothetical protein
MKHQAKVVKDRVDRRADESLKAGHFVGSGKSSYFVPPDHRSTACSRLLKSPRPVEFFARERPKYDVAAEISHAPEPPSPAQRFTTIGARQHGKTARLAEGRRLHAQPELAKAACPVVTSSADRHRRVDLASVDALAIVHDVQGSETTLTLHKPDDHFRRRRIHRVVDQVSERRLQAMIAPKAVQGMWIGRQVHRAASRHFVTPK